MDAKDVINEKIAENTGLVYKVLNEYNLIDDQDAESSAYEALHKAILTYDITKGARFSTYAMCVIRNGVRHHIRKLKRKRQLEVVSYYTPCTDIDDVYLLDVLKMDNDVLTQHLSEEACITITKAFVAHKNALPGLHRSIIDMWYNSDRKMSQSEIALANNVSQATVSRVISNFMYRLSKELEEYL